MREVRERPEVILVGLDGMKVIISPVRQKSEIFNSFQLNITGGTKINPRIIEIASACNLKDCARLGAQADVSATFALA